jgi:predicted nucleic-acid-binding protein
MRAVDSYVLVRLITRDDSRQVAAAESFVAGGAWVSHVVLVETVWVLSAVHGLGAAAIATAVEMLLNHQHLAIQDADVVATALVRHRTQPSITLSDYLVLEIARKAGHVPLGTFERQLARLDGAQKL